MQFAPVYERIAADAARVPSLAFYAFDLSANDPPPVTQQLSPGNSSSAPEIAIQPRK